jgi:hypothetical protein
MTNALIVSIYGQLVALTLELDKAITEKLDSRGFLLAFAQAARPAVPLITNLLGESTMSKTHKDLVQFKAKQDTKAPKPRKHGARYKREQVQKREWKSGLEYRLGRDD